MSSRRGNNNAFGVLIAVVVIFVISAVASIIEAVVAFVKENYIIIIFIIAIIILLRIFLILDKKIREKRKIKEYESTPYFKDTAIPYSIIIKNKGILFESYVFNELKKSFPDSMLITNLLIPRLGSINEYSEIDMVLLHKTGLYVLELKNYSGYIFGNHDNEYWNVGYKNNGARTVHEFLNPIIQNQQHIKDLEQHINASFKSHIIFSDETEIDSNIDNVSYLIDFINLVNSAQDQYLSYDLVEIYNKIKKINVSEKMDMHIERIKYNKTKYSKYNHKI